MKLEHINKRQLLPIFLLSIAMSFMLCLYAPLELYLTNVSDFWFDLYVLFPVMFCVFLLCTCLLSGFLCVMACFFKRLFPLIFAFIFGIFIALYIQGNYLVSDLPVLDGSVPNWESFGTAKVISAIVWGSIIVVCVALMYRLKSELFGKIVSFGSVCITLMLLFTGIILMISGDGLIRKQMPMVTTEDEFEMSTDTNFIVLMVDSVDSRVFDTVMEKHPEYVSDFEDFTYYSNTVSGYPFTEESLPFIFSGVWYENERNFNEYLAEVYGEAPLFDKLEALDYKMGMYSICLGRADDESVYRFTNIKATDIAGIVDYPGFVKLMLKYVGFRYLPYQLKEACFNRIYTEFSDFRGIPDGYELVEEHNNAEFFGKLKKEDVISLTDEKVFKCLHVEAAHVPFVYNEDVEVVEDATFESSVEASMTIVNTYLERLKAAGVYDNSVIVVMADHGYETMDAPFPRYNAFLMIKGLGEKKEFEISKAPISHVDMAQAFERLLEGADSTSVFDWKEGDERERRHFFYYGAQEEHMEEYMVGTDSRNLDTAYATGRVYDR